MLIVLSIIRSHW